ncbi:hypothetical protein FKF61_21575 [Salmonella enterica]|uniref:Uncharacterized protein n=1 Tax=Salmonella phage F61 TaxID=2982033 RepID=A0A977R8Q8_9CAUD|nr:hypothetical protein [Salmonella enterica]QIN92562.1 hypothetical protein [Phage NBSal001]UXM05335.1 hypothetical protein [Salmonella phage F115]UXM05386.1 hypothetical protein [Salmonella phage F61]HBI4576221.1 hypothetical protein [Salmonella enterica subsp. enterica serovar Infantis]
MRVLIVFETNPEGVKFFDIEMTNEQYDIVKTAQGVFVNCNDPTPGTDFLNIALCEKMEYLTDEDAKMNHACIWKDKIIMDLEKPAKFDAIIYTGIMC